MALSLERALQEQEEKVDGLLRAAGKYVSALKSWKKACTVGHIGDMQKASAQAEELVGALPGATEEAWGSWTFDVRSYLESGEWRTEIQALALEKHALKTTTEDENLISSPIAVRALPGRNAFAFGKKTWANIRPRMVALELKKLRDKSNATNSQEFLESIYGACVYLSDKNKPQAKFRDIYELFCLTPGYKRENPPAAFAQQIYALHRSDVRTTRAGRKHEFEFATGNYKEKDVFSVISEDGRLVRYFNIWFK
jgi:hypothetical protein